jgi:hypothetical protein
MRLRELFEAAAPKVGRKYQHIEDLVITNGVQGGLHAVERLRDMLEDPKSIELKWDGSPVVYWGRDEEGRFSLIPKNAWEYLKRGKQELDNGVKTVMYNPNDIKDFILGTGKADPEKQKEREQYASDIAGLWDYFEKASPPKGYVEGGILFRPGQPGWSGQPNPETGEFDFTPNITSFHIGPESSLYERIKGAKVMVAVTGYYEGLGSGDETRYPDAEQLSTDDVIVQGTTFVEKLEGADVAELDRIEEYLTNPQAADAITRYLAPKPGLSSPAGALYNFLNTNLRKQNLVQAFQAWAPTKLSAGQSEKMLADPQGLSSTLRAVEMLTNAKMQVIQAASAGTHGGIRQTKPEGYAQAHPGKQFKSDIPGQFVKAIDQANWAPKKD